MANHHTIVAINLDGLKAVKLPTARGHTVILCSDGRADRHCCNLKLSPECFCGLSFVSLRDLPSIPLQALY